MDGVNIFFGQMAALWAATGLPPEWMLLPLLGLAVGFVVGLTGVGGGSLMTPALILGMGVPPAVAVGTDLLYATATKTTSLWGYLKGRLVEWRIVFLMSAGSIPGALASMLVLSWMGSNSPETISLIRLLLGVALVLTAIAVLGRRWLLQTFSKNTLSNSTREGLTVLCGLVIGVLVAWTSVGAGAIGTAVLLLLFNKMSAGRLVATEVAHAVPLTLLTGLGHLGLGNIDFQLLGLLLLGSIPGALLGSRLTGRVAEGTLRGILALMLGGIGLRMVISA